MSSSKATATAATAATAAAATPLSVKVSADGQIRRFTIPSEGTAALRFAALQKVLRENYADKLKAGATLKFADDEGDYCVLSSAAEFAEAVRLLGNPPATLKLFLTANASAAPVTVTATTPVAAPAPASPAKIYPALPAKPVATAAVATPVKAAAAAAAPAAGPAPKVEPAPKPAVAAKASPVPAAKPVAVAPTATAATDAKASPKSTDSKDTKSADAKAEATPEEQVREKRRAFRTALRAALADEKVRAALKELVPAGIQAVEALANGSDKRSLSAVLTALVASSTVLSANEFIAKQALPRAVAKLDAVEQLVRPFLPTVVPFLPLAAVHLPEQIDRLAERLEQREKFAEQWRAAKAAGACGKGTDCPKKGQFGKMFGFGGPFMRGCGRTGLLRGLFRGCAEQNTTGADGAAAAEENGCGAFPKELKDLFRALRGHGPFVPRHGHQGHHGHGHGFGHGHWRRHCGGRSRSRDNKENTTAAAGDASAAAAAAAEKTADGKVIHYRVTCDGCGADPLVGVRFKCTQCRNFDLCEACEATNKHPADHALMKIRVSRWNADGRRRRSPSRDATPSGPVVHTNIECDGCNASPIVGVRFKCTQCPDFDLCGTCEEAGKHSEHTLLKMKTADSAPAHGRRHGHGHGGCHRPGAGMGMSFGPFGPFAGPYGGPHRHGHGHHHAHGHHPFGPHPFGPRGPWGRRGRGCGAKAASSSSGSSGSDSESDTARATAAQVAELVAANPFLASAIEGVEVRRAAPDAADPNTASIPVDVTAGPQALLAALLPTVFTKHNAAKAAAAPATKKPEASATTASAPTAAAAPAKDEKGAAVKPVAAPIATAAVPKAAAASKFDADVEQLKSMGFSGHTDATLRQLLAVAEAKKHRRFHSNVAWVVDALLSGAADKYL